MNLNPNTIDPGFGEKVAAVTRGGIKIPLVETNLPLTAFGSVETAAKEAQVQVKFSQGILHPDVVRGLSNKAGSTVAVVDSQVEVTCSSTPESYSQVRTLDTVRYSPGQGIEILGTCQFTTGVANSSQVFGAGDDDEGFFFGYDGTVFGVLRRSFGSLELKSLGITAAATGTGTITITLDGTAVPVEVVSGDSIQVITEKIIGEAAAFFNAGRGWEVHTDDNLDVEFISIVAEPAAGAFTFVDTDTTGVTAGAFSTTVTGVVPTEDWTPQTAWSDDKMAGDGPSKMTLDPSKGNVFKMQFQYLGYGEIEFFIENSETGRFQLVHRIKYANSAIIPSLCNPTLHLTTIAKTESGYAGGALVLKTASFAGFIQGKERQDGPRRSVSVTKAIGTTETPLLILHNELELNGSINKVAVYPDFASFANDAGKTVTLILYKNPTRIDGSVGLTRVDDGVSVMESSSTGTAFAGGTNLLSFVMGGNVGGERPLNKLAQRLLPGERWLITAKVASGSGGDVSVSFTWTERL